MKVLFNKIKKVNKIFLCIYTLVLILYAVCYIFFLKNLIGISVETAIRLIVSFGLLIWFIIYFLWGLVNLILKKHVTLAIISAISIILSMGIGIITYYLGMFNSNLDNIAEKEYLIYNSNLVVLKDNKITKDSTLGIISKYVDNNEYDLAQELIKQEKLENNKLVTYNDFYEMINDLLNKNIDGIFITSNNLKIFNDEEFKGLNEAEIVYTYSKKLKNEDTELVGNKSLTEPFTILLMGVDSEADGLDASTSFNGDTLMLITFNPNTLNATMFSIPRDTYVPIACNHNRYAKINSSAAYGTSCVINTIEQLTDIDIDYYVKINFKGVVDLVEALGGITVDVEVPDYQTYYNTYNGKVCEQNSLRQFGDKLVCMDTGVQNLNGEQALAYARCRHGYLMSDIARNKHQQQIIEALAKKAASPDNIGRLKQILEAVTNNIDTNMKKEQIFTFYDVLKDMTVKTFKDGNFLTIEKTYLEYYNLPVRMSNNGLLLSAIGYYPGSLEAIVNLMKANLELEEKELIKTFSFDANEKYTKKVTGQGITTGDKLITMPNFVGLQVSEAETWALNNNIELSVEYATPDSEFYNQDILPGMIANQSVNNGVLINNITELTVYINSTNSNNEDNQDNQNNDNDDNIESNTDNKEDNNQQDNDPLDTIFPGLGYNNTDGNENANQIND